MPALIYDFSVQKLYFKIFMSGSDTIVSEKDLEMLFDLNSEDIALLVAHGRIKFLFIKDGRLYFRLVEICRWLQNAYKNAL